MAFLRSVFAILVILGCLPGRAAESAPLITLSSVVLDESYQIQLTKALASEAPSMILVSDNENLRVGVFVSGQPERLDPQSYILVDVLDSTNGKAKFETPQGLFKLVSQRMKEQDFSRTYGQPLYFTLFWRSLKDKLFDGIAFHAASEKRLENIGVTCSSHGCVNLLPEKAEKLFHEVKRNFSAHQNGSDVLIISANSANKKIPSGKEWSQHFENSMSYWDRWSQFAATQPEIAAKSYLGAKKIRLEAINPGFNQEKLLIDSRRPIAGNGDTASSIYLIQNLIRRGFTGNVDILVDDKSERILSALSRNLPGFAQRVNLIREAELPPKEYSLVIRSGLPSGRIFIEGLRKTSDQVKPEAGKINVNARTVFLSMTIYGNTKNKASMQPLSLVGQGDQFFLLPATGLDVSRSTDNQMPLNTEKSSLDFSEAGIFRDPFSLSIRNWSLETAEKFLLKQTKMIDPNLHLLMRAVIDSKTNQNSKYGLAYGFSIPQVKKQARDYFRGLLASPSPRVILTPSVFGESLLQSFSEEERSRIRLTSLKEFTESGHKLATKHLTVVQIPNVPHQIFATLLLASNRNRIVPLGAGDGFFTTALSLGIPFAPTIVEWNIRNVRSLGRILQLEGLRQGLDFSYLQNLRRVYSAIPSDPIELAYSQQLLRYDELFRSAITQIPDLTETVDKAVGYLRETTPEPKGFKPMQDLDRVFTGNTAGTGKSSTAQDEKYQYGDSKQCHHLF